MLKDHVLNRLMTGRFPHKSLQLRPKFHSLFSKIASIFKKVLHLKDLNRHLQCTDVSFNLEKKSKSDTQTDRQSDRQSDYCNPLARAC